MNYFITGATGFVGTHLVRYFSEKKGRKLYLLTRKESKLKERLSGVKGIVPVMGTLFSDFKIPDDTKVVIHIAGLTKTKNPKEYYRINAEGTKRILKKSLEIKNIEKFLYISSLSAGGPSRDCRPVAEDDEPCPVSHYGKSKLLAEKYILEMKEKINSVILRPPIIYGEWDRDFLETIKLVKKGVSLSSVYERDERMVSIVYVGDLVRAIDHFIEKETSSGEIFYVGEDRNYRWGEIEDTISKILKVELRYRIKIPLYLLKAIAFLIEQAERFTKKDYIINRDKIAEIKERCWIFSTKKMNDYGFYSETSLEEGLRKTIDWAIKKGWL